MCSPLLTSMLDADQHATLWSVSAQSQIFVAQPEKGLTMAKRVVLVTGSAGGIGSSIADRFDELGDTVVGLDLINGFDVTEPSACAAAVADVVARYGRIDVLCNNAGVGAVGDVVAGSPSWSC